MVIQNGCFNPRSHEGSDRQYAQSGKPVISFNPRSHEGSDGYSKWAKNLKNEFQSTLPRRERPVPCGKCHYCRLSFNPRSHEGSDLSRSICSSLSKRTFQSTLPRRERRRRSGDGPGSVSGFNPRSHEGSDHAPWCPPCRFYVSIHAPTKGATSTGLITRGKLEVSIHAPTKGAT